MITQSFWLSLQKFELHFAMNHKELMQELQHRIRLDKQQTATLMTCLERILTDDAVAIREVVWAGMGRFISHKHPEYVEQNATTGETVLYPPRITYRFQADRTLEDNGLIEKLATRSGVEAETVFAFLTKLADCIMDALGKGEEVNISGLGSFSIIDVRQGEARRVAYLPDEKMRDAVNAPFSCFEPMVIESRFQATETPALEEPLEDTLAEPSETAEPVSSQEEPEEELQLDPPSVDESPILSETAKDMENPRSDINSDNNGDRRRSLGWVIAASVLLPVLTGAAIWMFTPSKEQAKRKETVQIERPRQISVTDSSDTRDTSFAVPNATTEADSSPEALVVTDPTPQTPTTSAAIALNDSAARNQPTEEQILKENGSPVREELKAGQRLTLVALKYYGSKAFWPYIYEVNRFQLNDPNNVPVGINLYLPDPIYWGIDSTDEHSLAKAKIKAAKLINQQ